jgi:hypothetical protein
MLQRGLDQHLGADRRGHEQERRHQQFVQADDAAEPREEQR